MTLKKTLSVGEVSKRCGVKISALHFYEKKGLINSGRNSGNQRRYSRDVLRRVSIIKAAQQVGVQLDKIKEAFENLPNNRTPTKQDWERLASLWQSGLTQKIQYLERLRDYLTGCIGCGCLSMEVCPLYNPDDECSLKASGPVLLDKKK